MQSTLPPKPSDDPCDVVMVAPDAVRVAPADDPISSLLHQAARRRSDLKARPSAAPTAPPVDTTFRPASHDAVPDSPGRRPVAGRAMRNSIALLLAACVGVAAVAWKSYGDAATKQTAKLAAQLMMTAPQSSETPASATPSEPPAVQANAANATSPQTAPPARSAPETAAPVAVPSPDSTLLLQSMARDLASLGQEVEQLKAGIEQLKANQQQMSRNMAKASDKVSDKPSDQTLRARAPGPPPRPAVAQARKPLPASPPAQAAAAAGLPPPPAAPYYAPRQPDSQPEPTAERPLDPELSSVPRPPMPLR